ncbi:uncharacterized protein LOC116767122 [Danaus plexippus]|uniref:uncharacterized protein LOC116767122 n=1 Tax=Danaus plexippus TaxID=13037 RepID=UPI002AB2F5D9|nr:uncharacterized protein LOC116767122 [Danaus plexippus]
MDRLNQIRSEAGSSQDLTLDTSSPLSEAFLSANESSSKYFSLSEVDSTFGISPAKDSISTEAERTLTADTNLIPQLSPIPKRELDSYKIGKQIEAANILSGGVNIFDDNDNSYDGDELVIDDNVVEEEKSPSELKLDENAVLDDKAEVLESLDDEVIPSKDTEVVLQIDGNNVHAIDIGNGLYLYRKAGEEDLAALQMIDDDQQQPSFKFLKVRENAEGNLEVYEEIEVEVTKEVPIKEGEIPTEKSSHVPIKDISKVINEPSSSKTVDNTIKTPKKELSFTNDVAVEPNVDASDPKVEVSFNGKMKFNESRKSPVIGTYTPMTYHSTPNKEGIPLTKTMVDQQLHPSRHTDNVKKTIEVHTESPKQKLFETQSKTKKSVNETLSPSEDIKESDSLNKKIHNKIEDSTNMQLSQTEQSELSEKLTENDLQLSNNINEISVNEPSSVDIEKEIVDNSEVAIIKPNNDNAVLAKVTPDIELLSDNSKIMEQCETEENSMDEMTETDKNQHKDDDKQTDNIDEGIQQAQTNKVIKETESPKNLCDDEGESHLTIDDTKIITTSEPNEEVPEKDNAEISTNNIVPIEVLAQENNTEELVTASTEYLNDGNKIVIDKSSNQIIDDKELNKETNDTDLELNKGNETKNEIVEDIDVNKVLILTKKSEEVISENVNNLIENTEEVISDSNSKQGLHSNNTENVKKSPEISENCNIQKVDNDSENTSNSIKKYQNEVIENINKNETDEMKICTHQEDTSGPENNCKNETAVKKIVTSKNVEVNSVATEKNKIISEPKTVSLELPIRENPVNNTTSNAVTEQKTTDIEKCPGDIKQGVNVNDANKKLVDKQDSLKSSVEQVEIKSKPVVAKAINNNSAVPFGKWTEANRQEFLNKIKETKIPTNNSNTKQLKQPNDLNRRDVLKKIDSQRQSNIISLNKGFDTSLQPKLNTKVDSAVFVSKSVMVQQSSSVDTTVTAPNIQNSKVKSAISVKPKQDDSKNSLSTATKNVKRKEINNQDLIDKTIEDIINRSITGKVSENTHEKPTVLETQNTKTCPVSLDEIEMKMNDIHGVASTETTIYQQTYSNKPHVKSDTVKAKKAEKVPHLLPFKNKVHSKNLKDNARDDTSDDEIIEHEPITGDLESNKKGFTLLPMKNKSPESKKETIITEKDFDKFARRNSITYENCLTVSFDGKESHNVIQTVVEKDPPVKKLSRNELMLAESKAKSTNKHLNMPMRSNTQNSRIPTLVKAGNDDDAYNKNSHSKVQIAYQTALTAKRNLECPITIIEDKPVKVVFMDSNSEFTPSQLNVQGQELSPPKADSEISIHSTSESLDSDVLDSCKNQDEIKIKSKHQRKQVLTPVEEPEIELIEPVDLGIRVSLKKKRRCEEKVEKHSKNVVPKKSYLLNRNVNDEKLSNKTHDFTKKCDKVEKETEKRSDQFIGHTDTISAIDNLVKAAELIETQSENKSSDVVQTPEQPSNTPVKRGRGRPRKYPLVESGTDTNKTPTPQKKPRLIDAKVTKKDSTDSDDSSDDVIIKENWTMGKINENIVCPICNKLFRSENVVFKHVKHCPGPSPNRSDSDKRSPVRLRRSQDSDRDSSISNFSDSDEEIIPRSRRSRYASSKLANDNDVIVIEDTPIKEKPEHEDKETNQMSKKCNIKMKPQLCKTHNLICEFCGKTFRQLSYLVNHKMQHHKKDNDKNSDTEPANKTVFSCEVCKKDFRKLHHLVKHRLIHNSNANNVRITRKSSSDQHPSNQQPLKHRDDKKSSNDASAGFRCEPCDKSFRKLHHLVEHRDTHDGINKKSSATSISSGSNVNESVNLTATYNCDTCKKVYKKLQDLLEHKEMHFETSSEKSDDKSVKSSLSTKDIIHECSLCYMVFPNEHSLNKHTIICLRKKKQSAAKAAKQALEKGTLEGDNIVISENEDDESPKNTQEINDIQISKTEVEETVIPDQEVKITDALKASPENKVEGHIIKRKLSLHADVSDLQSKTDNKAVVIKQEEALTQPVEDFVKPPKVKKTEIEECIVIPDTPTPKKKILVKDKEKLVPTIKKNKTVSYPTLPVAKETKAAESSDDDDIRYMLNPNFKAEETAEGKVFMKVRAKKRNSLQIERPNSKDLVKRRISLQHPPKIPRLKARAVETKPVVDSKSEKPVKLSVKQTVSSTDSDDSDVKYSFPDPDTTEANKDKKKKQTVATKRKSGNAVAKRKSLGKHKLATPKTRKRTSEVEHRCDCGQLFSSAALLSRHTTLAHTPPRIRRRRSPPPEITKKTPKAKPKQAKRKSDVTNPNTVTKGVGTRKSSVNNSDAKVTSDATKKYEFSGKSLRSSAIRVPVFDKMKKVIDKTKK